MCLTYRFSQFSNCRFRCRAQKWQWKHSSIQQCYHISAINALQTLNYVLRLLRFMFLCHVPISHQFLFAVYTMLLLCNTHKWKSKRLEPFQMIFIQFLFVEFVIKLHTNKHFTRWTSPSNNNNIINKKKNANAHINTFRLHAIKRWPRFSYLN